MWLLILLEGCNLFEFRLLIGNRYDHPWPAGDRLVNPAIFNDE